MSEASHGFGCCKQEWTEEQDTRQSLGGGGLGGLSGLIHHCGFTTIIRKDGLTIYQANYMLHFESPLL